MRLAMTAFIAIILSAWNSAAYADVDVGVRVDNDGIKEFHLAVGDFYGYPEKEVIAVRARNIPDDELPVVFFLAKRARVAPDVIIALRLGGKSWLEISSAYNLGPDIYYVPAKVVSGPPYGRALGYYKNHPREEWGKIKLLDNDIVNLVNLRFLSKHYGCSYDDVIRVRSEGKSFVAINHDAKGGKLKKAERSEKGEKHKSKSGKAGKSEKKNKKK